MSTRYLLLLETIKGRLAALVPDRVVTREFKDHADRSRAELAAGIYTIQAGPIGPYPYEASDDQAMDSELRATECARMRLTIIGQRQLPVNCSGEDVDAAEFEMLAELERLADEALGDEVTASLLLLSALPSRQAEKPYAWIHTEWEVFPLD